MRRVWSWLVVTRVAAITGMTAASSRDVDNLLANFDEPPMEMAQAIRFAMLPYGMKFPDKNSQTIAAARQYSADAPTEFPRLAGTLLVKSDGILAMALDQSRTIESAGLGLTIITDPAPGRYAEAWEIPGVVYLGGKL